MAVDANIQLGYKDSAWFTANASLVLLAGQHVYLSDGVDEMADAYVIGDGTTTLDSLPLRSLRNFVSTVSGTNVDNTDPLNPVVNTSTIYVTGSITAENDKNYINQSGANTYTDPASPSAGTYYNVLVAAGSATIGGTAYSVTTRVLRYYNGSAWLSYKTNSNNTGDETVNTLGATINGASSATPNDTDLVVSVESSVVKKNTWTQIKAFLKTYFDTVYLSLSGGSLTGALNEAKSTDVASAATTDIGAATGNLIHITGTTTITSFGTIQAGTKRNLVFDGALILTNSANIILPGNVSITTSANDTAIFVSEGAGVWRCLSYYKYDESYTNYTPTFTGFSVNPTINSGDARWKMLTKNTCHVIIWATSAGTSNATTMTVTLPFTAAWSGGSGFGLQQSVMGVYNNGINVNGSVRTRVSGSNILDCYNGVVGTAFTSSGSKGVFLNFIYQIEI